LSENDRRELPHTTYRGGDRRDTEGRFEARYWPATGGKYTANTCCHQLKGRRKRFYSRLSGPLTTSAIYEALAKFPTRKYNYGFLFVPARSPILPRTKSTSGETASQASSSPAVEMTEISPTRRAGRRAPGSDVPFWKDFIAPMAPHMRRNLAHRMYVRDLALDPRLASRRGYSAGAARCGSGWIKGLRQ